MGILKELATIFYTDQRHKRYEKELSVKKDKSRSILGSNIKSKNL